MKRKIILLLLFVSVSVFESVFAQQEPPKKDSLKIYKDLETFSDRNKLTKIMHQMLFKPLKDAPVKHKYRRQTNYSAFEGKIIRNIDIVTLDPFGNSATDTNVRKQNFINRTGNYLHIKSRRITIRNLLIIRQNQPFDGLRVKESERLVRSQAYITAVSFFVKTVSRNSDSVDISIRVLDKWSLIPEGSTSLTKTTFGLSDKNFLGLGHEFKNEYTQNYTELKNSFGADYSIPNLKNTYISTTIHYAVDGDKYFKKSLSFDRPFFSPFAKWAAGVNFTQQFLNDSTRTNNSLIEQIRFKFNAQDYWAGNAIQIFKGSTEDIRTTNFISAVRFYKIRYVEKPIETINNQGLFSDENLYLVSFGVSTRKYVQDKYIFRYGLIEDVPIGRIYSLTGGYQEINEGGRVYLGTRFSSGNYHSWGYLSSNIEYGIFLHNSKIEQGVFRAGLNYYTKLYEFGNWKFRQFVKPQIIIGINQFTSDRLTLNDEYGLVGFNSTTLVGKSRLLLTLQTQSYNPWDFLGFQFGPYFNYSIGMLADDETRFRKSKVYSQIGLGVIIRNENLIFSVFQISLAFYPSIPGVGNNIFKMNSFETTDFGFRDFEIGKPAPVEFR